jgi:hypothetical protein
VCKKERGYLLAFRIVVKEYGIENPFHTASVNEDTHGPGPSLYLSKRSFNKIGGTDLLPQGHLGSLEILGPQPLPLLWRKLHLIKREQIINL